MEITKLKRNKYYPTPGYFYKDENGRTLTLVDWTASTFSYYKETPFELTSGDLIFKGTLKYRTIEEAEKDIEKFLKGRIVEEEEDEEEE